MKTREAFRIVGRGIPRLDAGVKVRGQAEYADDIPIPDVWYGHVVRSPVPHGHLKKLTFDPNFDWSRVVVVTPEDIPGENIVEMLGRDMPFIAHDLIRYRGEPLALVAAPTRQEAEEAAAKITPEIQSLDPILTLNEVVDLFKKDRDALDELWAQTIVKGDAAGALDRVDRAVEDEYWCGHQEQMYIEPQGMAAIPEDDGGVFIQGSMQCPYYINPELTVTLDLPPEKIRVKQTSVGGAFGGKEEFPTLIAGYCALLALKGNRPVKMIFDRHQDILYTTKRHPAWIRHRAGLNRDGSITGMEIDFILDAGAYTTLSPVVLFRGILHAAMGYRCENIVIHGHVFRTNTFPNGAFRGFGAPQAIWGLESHIDRLAAHANMAPHEFRRKNCLVEGDITPTGQCLTNGVGSPEVLERALEKSHFSECLKRCTHGAENAACWYGVGCSFFAHGAGFTGDGEAKIRAKVALELDRWESGEPGVTIRVSSTEMGQGTGTILPQIVAEGLSVPISRVRCPFPDTRLVPDSGPTVASRTAMVVGHALYIAGRKMKTELEAFAGRRFFDGQPVELDDGVFTGTFGGTATAFVEVADAWIEANGPLRIDHRFKLSDSVKWNQDTFEGDAYPAYSWGCNVVEVEIDRLTYELKVLKITAVYDIGTVINPVLAKGQVEGGLVQALGYAMMEKISIKDGLYDADRMQTYVIPTAMDIPEMDIEFVEYPYEDAFPGAKGVGEIPMDGLAPALANAVEAAAGVRLRELPITPEKLFEALV